MIYNLRRCTMTFLLDGGQRTELLPTPRTTTESLITRALTCVFLLATRSSTSCRPNARKCTWATVAHLGSNSAALPFWHVDCRTFTGVTAVEHSEKVLNQNESRIKKESFKSFESWNKTSHRFNVANHKSSLMAKKNPINTLNWCVSEDHIWKKM